MAVQWYGPEVMAKVRAAAYAGVVTSTESVFQLAIQKIQSGPKTGRIYRRRSVEHQASAPGESPASDTGALVQSGRTEFDMNNLMGTVIFSTAYAAALEFGTVKMAPRPYARPALAEKREEIEKNISDEIASVLK